MKKLLLCVIFALFLLPLAVMGQCGTENLTAQDAEGTTFNSVKVGPHCWLKPNLSIKLDSSKIYKSEMYPDTDANLATFGRLYDWYTAMNVQPGQSPVVGEHGFVQAICPEGWHLPTEAETRELMNYDAKTLHATEHWFVPGTNTTGFTMLPGGYYNAMKKYGENLGGDCYMWSAQSLDPSNPTVIWSDCHCEYFLVNRGSAVNGMSVRCVYKIYQGEVTTDSVKEITDQSATLYGTIAFSGYDEEYERGFVYGTDPDNLDQWAVESSTASDETAPFNTEITGLTVATTYYYQAYIVNDFDTVWGEIKDFTTLQIQVTTDSASNITHYTATLYGNLIYVNSSVNAGFKYGTSEDALTSISNVSILSATGQYWADLVGLTEGTTYFFKAFAAHGTDTVYGEVKDFTTKYIEVETSAASNIKSTSATLNGELTILKGYENANVGFKYGTSESALTSIVAKDAAMTATGLFSCDIDGLTVNTKYYFKAFAANGTDTVYGEVKNFKTLSINPCPNATIVTDIDNNVYNTIQIGKQCWMAQNLRTKIGGDGDKGYPTEAGNDTVTYGRLYTWSAMMNGEGSTNYPVSGDKVQGICPTGWHVPSNAEWDTLTTYVNGVAEYRCGETDKAIANALSAATGWQSPSECGAGHNSTTLNKTGFSAVPAGSWLNDYVGFGYGAYFWSATQDGSDYAYRCGLNLNSANVGRSSNFKRYGFSVRCLRDKEAPAVMSVTTDSANTITNSTATLHGTVTNMGGKDNVYAGFKYGTSESALTSIAADESAMYATGRFSYTITDLTANTQYYFKAFAANGTDTVYGEVKNFTTNFICGIDSIKDADNNWYHTVNMAGQCWMKENLKTTNINGKGAYYPTEENDYVSTYGRLYDWTAAMQGQTGEGVRGICPENWHLPTDAEWKNVESAYLQFAEGSVDDLNYRGTGAGKFTGSNLWGTGGSGTCPNNNAYEYRNITNFTALPAGYYNGSLNEKEIGTYFWTSTSNNDLYTFIRNIDRSHEGIKRSNAGDKAYYYSVRCLRDPEVLKVTTDSANTVTKNSAKLHGNVTNMGGKDNVYAGFKYGTSESTLTSIAADESAMYATGRFSYTITGLTANTQYYFKAFAANGTDTVYGEVKDFKTMSFSCLGTPKANERGITDAIDSVVDVDGNAYNTVQIGNQCWMAENLRTTKYAGGTGIELGSSTSTETAYRYNPGNSSYNVSTYGYLYNWKAVMNTSFSSEANPSGVQGVCPTGWHVPSDAEWDTLTTYVNSVADYKCNNVNNNIANALSAATGWQNPSECCAGSEKQTLNKTGFSAVPAGFYNDVDYFCFGSSAYFWSATQYNSDFAYYRYLDCNNASVSRESIVKYYGYSVRCLRDEEAPAAMSVTTDSANTVTNNTATLHGTVTNMGGKDNVYAGFKYGTSESTLTSIVVKDAAMTATGLFSCDITGLTTNTKYYFKAFAANGTDTVYGEVKNFTTTSADGQPCPGAATVTDYDNNTYNTVQIGNQCWMKENLKTTHYADGTSISLGSSTSTTTAYRYYPKGGSSNVGTYGYLYNWKAVMRNSSSSSANPSGVQGVCPNGWHVPSDSEWTQLTDYVSGQSKYVCGENNTQNIAKALASTTGWNSYDEPCAVGNKPSANNATGFSAVPAGYYYGFYTDDAGFWSATQEYSSIAYYRYLTNIYATVGRSYINKGYGLSVRCLRDKEAPAAMSVTTDSANTVTNNSAKLYGNVTSMGSYAGVNAGFKYGTSESTLTSIVVKDAAMTATGLFSCDITGLTTNTKYYFKAFAANGTDTVYGEVKNFTTTGSSTFTCGTDKVKDVQENEYPTVQIGKQCWMAQNLRTNVGGGVYPKKDSQTVTGEDTVTYGRLYTWSAMMKEAPSTNYPAGNTAADTIVHGICPAGWHVPSEAEWTQLTNYVKSQSEYQCKSIVDNIAKALASKTGWSSSSENACAVCNNQSNNNATGFSAVPAGYCFGGSFSGFGNTAVFWSATQGGDSIAWCRSLFSLDSEVSRYRDGKGRGLSVRCVRDAEVPAAMSVTTDSANTVTNNSAKLYGNVTSMGKYTEVNAGFKYGTSESTLTSIVVKDVAMAATGLFSCDIDGLTANTQYYFKAFAANGTDTVYGEVKNFTTTGSSTFTCGTDKVKDVQENEYPTVQIGKQCWMAQNLRTNVGGGVYPKKDSQTVTGEEPTDVFILGQL